MSNQNPSTIVHEFLHVLGAEHEQNRPDRDAFVDIDWKRVRPKAEFAFFRDSWEGEVKRTHNINSSSNNNNKITATTTVT